MNLLYGTEPAHIAKPTVVCLHASGGSGAQWKTLARQVQPDLNVLTPDLYGHGNAPGWQGAPADIVAADTARTSRPAAEIGGAIHLVGHPYGGAIALRVALHHPERVASVAVYEPVAMRVLFDYHRRHRAAAEVAEVAGDIRRALNGHDLARAGERFVDYWAGPGHWAQLGAERRAAFASRMPVIHSHFVALRNDDVRLRDYARLDAPVLYLAGRATRLSARRMTELMTYALPNVELEMLDGMAHLGPITHADDVAGRIALSLRKHVGLWRMNERKVA